MAAGRGVIHSEMPMMEEGSLHGFQIWINQPARDKMKPAQYHDFQSETVTEFRNEEVGLLRLIAGNTSIKGTPLTGPLQTTGVPLNVSDWRAQAGQALTLTTESHHNAFVYVYKGSVDLGSQALVAGQLALLSKAEILKMSAQEESGVLIFSGEPINEPVVHYGPFVMNSMEEIEQTIHDFNNGVFETY